MIITTGQLLTLLVVITFSVWAMYKSRLQLLRTVAFAEQSKKQTSIAVNSILDNVNVLKKFNDEFEAFNKSYKASNVLMCINDKNKVCDFCGDGENCPFRKVGDK